MRLPDRAGCEWNGYTRWVGPVEFGWVVHDRNAINYTT